jgi:hypothetical protein
MANTLGPKWNDLRDTLWPGESHGIASDCPNPYCNYNLTEQDISDAEFHGGDFECPNCGWSYNISHLLTGDTRQRTRAGMTPLVMGQIGEQIIKQWADENGEIPGVGRIIWESPDYKDPIDLVAGQYAIEAKTLHSESYPRFKIAADPGSGASRSYVIRKKMERMQQLSQHLGIPLIPAMIGVRLNFYTNRADFFFQNEYKDRLMTAMTHLGSTDFSKLNPFKNPEDVAQQSLPHQGDTTGAGLVGDADIPF